MQKLVKKIFITDLVIPFGIGKLLLQANLCVSVTPYSAAPGSHLFAAVAFICNCIIALFAKYYF